MAVLVLEARDCTSPVFLVRTWALLCGCVTFSLVGSLEPEHLREPERRLNTFWIACMFTWCFFFTLTLLIHVLNVIQFHSLLPVSWKNLTVTVAALGALMTLSASVLLPWRVLDHRPTSARPLAAAVAACLTVLAYCGEVWAIRGQPQEQRGYMASLPGVLKIVQCWGGFQMIPLFLETMTATQARDLSAEGGAHVWQLWVSVGLYNVCLLMSLASVAVILCDCAGRFCPFPFDRLLAGFSLLGVLFYMVATVICVTNVLQDVENRSGLLIMETVIVSITLMAYTVDFSFSIKQLCERGHG
ncbi:myeloid-associated differentiation marker homolog [Gadus macrocephalus]|uniref:myeloid-associated differentiation marker homolog n=1 Tax=Gadus macrocephalus TaxID=80720 RepID=UPI0028CBB4F1|nr:myeloid-associated differentiation marker homolog [Gadus macrocephalus]